MVRKFRHPNGLIADCQKFIMGSNVTEVTVAVILGGAFAQIINSFVANIMTPALLKPAIEASGVEKLADLSFNGIQYGLFVASILSFFVIMVSIFLAIPVVLGLKNRFLRQEKIKKQKETYENIPSTEEKLIRAIEKLTQAIEEKN